MRVIQATEERPLGRIKVGSLCFRPTLTSRSINDSRLVYPFEKSGWVWKAVTSTTFQEEA